jgi:RES domain-containing protein
MIIYRLAIESFKDDLSGTGAKLYGGRWNSAGIPVLYTTENISLAVLEILVRTDISALPPAYHLVKLEVPDTMVPTIISKAKLKKEWKGDLRYTQWIGDEFTKLNDSLMLKVPSAIVEDEHNYILNTGHPDIKKVKLAGIKKFHFDKRLFLHDE